MEDMSATPSVYVATHTTGGGAPAVGDIFDAAHLVRLPDGSTVAISFGAGTTREVIRDDLMAYERETRVPPTPAIKVPAKGATMDTLRLKLDESCRWRILLLEGDFAYVTDRATERALSGRKADAPRDVLFSVVVNGRLKDSKSVTPSAVDRVTADADQWFNSVGQRFGYKTCDATVTDAQTVELRAECETQQNAEDFARELRLMDGRRLVLAGVRVDFAWAELKTVTRRLSRIEDIKVGLDRARTAKLPKDVNGDVVQFVGPTQAGKSTTIALLLGRKLRITRNGKGLPCITSDNPLCDREAWANYDVVRIAGGEAPPEEAIAGPSGMALCADHYLVTQGAMEGDPRVLQRFNPAGTAPDALRGAFDHMGHATTKDIAAYSLADNVFAKVMLDTPGTEDTDGLQTDVYNAVMRLRAAEACASVRLVVVLNYQLLKLKAAQGLVDAMTPPAVHPARLRHERASRGVRLHAPLRGTQPGPRRGKRRGRRRRGCGHRRRSTTFPSSRERTDEVVRGAHAAAQQRDGRGGCEQVPVRSKHPTARALLGPEIVKRHHTADGGVGQSGSGTPADGRPRAPRHADVWRDALGRSL